MLAAVASPFPTPSLSCCSCSLPCTAGAESPRREQCRGQGGQCAALALVAPSSLLAPSLFPPGQDPVRYWRDIVILAIFPLDSFLSPSPPSPAPPPSSTRHPNLLPFSFSIRITTIGFKGKNRFLPPAPPSLAPPPTSTRPRGRSSRRRRRRRARRRVRHATRKRCPAHLLFVRSGGAAALLRQRHLSCSALVLRGLAGRFWQRVGSLVLSRPLPAGPAATSPPPSRRAPPPLCAGAAPLPELRRFYPKPGGKYSRFPRVGGFDCIC